MLINNSYCFRIIYFIIINILLMKFWKYSIYYNLHDSNFYNPSKNIDYFNNISFKQNPESIKVLSYNVFLRPPIVNHKHNEYKNERCNLISQILPLYDIILLQEVHTCFNQRSNKLIKETNKNGLIYHYSTYGPTIFSKYLSNNGLLLLSRYPIIENDYITFNKNYSFDSIVQKGVTYSKIKIKDNKFIHVFNAHLQSSYKKDDMFSESIRNDQLSQLKKFIDLKTQNFKNEPIICGGDFNINYFNNIERDRLYSKLLPLYDTLINSNKYTIKVPYDYKENEDNSICLVCKECCKINHNSVQKQRLDYIFHNDKIQPIENKILPFAIKQKDYPFKNLSDHFAIYTEFKL